MAARLTPSIPLPLNPDVLKEIVEKAKDWALMHGACMRSKTNFSEDSLYFAPFALLPSTFPTREYNRAVALQPVINELMHKVAHDHDFLEESLKNTIKVDEFTGGLYKVYEKVRKEGFGQRLSLGLVRADLMLETCKCEVSVRPSGSCGCRHTNPSCVSYCCWKQVEFNTIAAGFGWLGPASGLIHRYVLQELGYPQLLKNLPENPALTGLSNGMLEAWDIFGNKNAVILFVIEDVTYNICDQRFLEFEIRKINPEVRIIRRTLTDIANTAKLGPKKELMVGQDTVAVVYFRAGYEPGHYHSQKEWDARLLMELSTAIKCPSIHYHLAGTKKVQQSLAKPGCLERFLDDSKKIQEIQDIFTGLYSLDLDDAGNTGVQKALSSPEKYVLKPQREGGGNNVYGSEIKEALLNMADSEERSAWILMDRIHPPVQVNYIVRPNQSTVELQDIVCELGIFGVVIGDEKQILTNRQVGHMLRSKLSSANEGGVAAGVGALDSPYLT
ncbi:glutathione synthetase-like isoform X1 [Macrosteles quadrilineatus]|uniref:glutathione synthetase-like isoform X1 n=1 Tax=Macrosteles quadrilineatus TaxID=74068 RepID=UPI0023E21114|nr:glutathione synthetase-like isoform X1 [Macrosteles quadrilineatus]XP_054275651.1 glutathione synthetase-like isoform X1 [Macrosteles quadrilineatus]XP_054275652.1 glutathione synthetase-like isoform X1 [Macrosteles quadrilineatus]